jgi:hypothetical protein
MLACAACGFVRAMSYPVRNILIHFVCWLKADRLVFAFKLAALECGTFRGLVYDPPFPTFRVHKQSSE